jgi:ATP-dependent RNA helicase RhlE
LVAIALPIIFHLNSNTLSFQELQLTEPVLRALQDEGYTQPTPIQQQSIPIILGRKDLLGCAQTGTGKTAAFAIPLLQLMEAERSAHPTHAQRPIRALVLTPTRELAIQIEESFLAYGRYLHLKPLVIFGGVSQHNQVLALRKGVDILVATPGRLLDLMNQKIVSLRDIRYFVLDEADRMLDMGFIHDVKRVIAHLPAHRQTLFFSATMPPDVSQLADSLLKNPSKVSVTPVSSTAETVQQSIYFVEREAKKDLLVHLLKDPAIRSALIFSRTKHGADKISKILERAGIPAQAIHGNKSQNARQNALQQFKNGQTRALVATDIAARGIDIDELSHVINYELPNVPETYVHRIGRTGRAGASGIAISFCDSEERAYLKDIQKLISRTIPVVSGHPWESKGGVIYPPQPAPGQRQQQQRGRNAQRPQPQQRPQQQKPKPQQQQKEEPSYARPPQSHRPSQVNGAGEHNRPLHQRPQAQQPEPIAERPAPTFSRSGGGPSAPRPGRGRRTFRQS